MRHLLNLLNEASKKDAEQIFFKLSDYITHLLEIDFYEIRNDLTAIGYKEIAEGGTFYRALFVEATEHDMGYDSIEDFIENKALSYFRQDNGPQSFATSLSGAISFVSTTYWSSRETPPDPAGAIPAKPFAVIYTVEVPTEAVLFTTSGLLAFIQTVPESSGSRALMRSLQEYQGENEAIADVSKVRVIRAQPYVRK